MNTREQFGHYLLLKKLTEDPLGESFRAGRLSDKGMERVVLLRVWNGQGLDGERLWQACSERAGIQQVLRSPNIGEGIEMGEVQGIPYVSYDYVSGRNLATLMAQASKNASPIPTEHALLITERVALALALAAEHRYQGKRILHGFVVPHLVMISNEGESRLLGFEMAPALRRFAANPVIRQHFGRYLAPEVMTGTEPHRADDTYSLGALLYELLTGAALPPPAADGYASVIDQATLIAGDRAPVPEPLRDLLRVSLVPRDERIGDVVTWHKTLNKWMFEGYNPTTFNLAFYMHNLFRHEIERESQEIEVEKTMPVPIVAPDSAAVPSPAPAVAGSSAAVPRPGTEDLLVAPPSGERSKAPLWIALAALLAVALGVAGWWWMGQRAADAEALAAQTALPVVPPPAPPPPIELMGPPAPDELAAAEGAEETLSPEEQSELQSKIDELVAERASALEAELRGKMDQQLNALRQQLAATEQAADEGERLLRERRAEEEAQRQRDAAAEAERLAALDTDAEPAAGPPGAAAPGSSDREPPSETIAAAPGSSNGEPAETAVVVPEPPAPPPPPRPSVRRGDLVEPGHPGAVPPSRLRVPALRFPEMARRASQTDATVVVRVLVDENGKVIDAQLQGKKVGYGFDAEALRVARRTTYQPAKVDGVPVKMWITVRVQFQ